jgi:rare lipoprotein A
MAANARAVRAAAISLIVLVLSACASSGPQRSSVYERRSEPAESAGTSGAARSERGNPPFYEVFGKRYHVLPTSAGYVARGVASWYGRDFHGLSTSSGEPYNMHAMTAAHTTLPLPTWVQVTNLENGKRVVVKVNDRGPFVDDRLIDLSYAAATELDMVRNGTARVEVRTVAAPLPVTRQAAVVASTQQSAGIVPAPVAPVERMFVQVGAFSDRDNAVRLVERLRASGFAALEVVSVPAERRVLHRVRLGPIADAAEFDRLDARLRGMGVAGARLVVERAP